MPQRVICTIHAFGLVCFLLLLLSILPQSTFCQTGWLAADYPDPRAQPEACGFSAGRLATVTPTTDLNTTWVCDPDHVLSIDEAILLDNFLKTISYKSPCDCEEVSCPGGDVSPTGYLIGLALVYQLNVEEGMHFEPINVKAATFAKDTRQKWFSGQGCDDTALVFYSKFSNEMYVSLGEKMEGVISDLELASMYEMGDYLFRDSTSPGDTSSGSGGQTSPGSSTSVYLGIEAILRQLNEAIRNGPSISSDVIFAFTIPLLLILVLTVMCLISNLCCAQDINVESTRGRSRMSEVSR